MKNLPFDCSCTDTWASPKNWKTISEKKALSVNWYVQCVFYDPLFKDKYPNGFPYRKKLNKIKDINKRRAAVKFLLEEIPRIFEEKGFNPITKKYMVEEVIEPTLKTDIGPETLFNDALDYAYNQLKVVKATNNDAKLVVRHFKKSVIQLRYQDLKIIEVRRKHIKLVIDNLENTKGKFSGHKFNKYRSYLQILFKELLEVEAVESNIINDIRKRTQIKSIRETLTKEQRVKVNSHLKENYPEFWAFTLIFFHSGGRITELLSVKIQDVDIKNQKYKVLIKKGNQYVWVERIIKDSVLMHWKKAIFGGKRTDYIFSHGLVPGEKKLSADKINRRWKRHVKDKLNITADFYSLKHSNLDETVALLSMKEAAAMANHTSTKMLENHYAIGEKERQMERLRTLNNKFA